MPGYLCISNGISRCVVKKNLTQNRRKQSFAVKFSDKKKFADSLWHGSLALSMPKPNKKNASDGFILGHEVLQKCSNFFSGRFRTWIGPEY